MNWAGDHSVKQSKPGSEDKGCFLSSVESRPKMYMDTHTHTTVPRDCRRDSGEMER
jgi:hypothetical protein